MNEIRFTKRVRRGMQRVLVVATADAKRIGEDFRSYGMSKKEWDDYLYAIQWIGQQAHRIAHDE